MNHLQVKYSSNKTFSSIIFKYITDEKKNILIYFQNHTLLISYFYNSIILKRRKHIQQCKFTNYSSK